MSKTMKKTIIPKPLRRHGNKKISQTTNKTKYMEVTGRQNYTA